MKIKLGELITEYSVRNKENENIPVFSVTNSQGFCKEYFNKDVASSNRTTYKIVPKGCFAYNPSRINVGSVDWQRHEDRVIVSPLYNVFSVSDKVENQYLYHYLKSKPTLRKINATATGSVRNNLKLDMLKEFCIDLPSLEEQQLRISILTTIESIINKRKNELSILDEFIKALFVEMFGTPYGNEKGFPMLTVDDVIEFTGGSQPDKKYFEYEPTEDNIRLIQVRDYKTDDYITYIPKSMAKRFCDADDIMIGRYGPPIFQILKGIEGSYNVALMKATPKMGNKEFIRNFLKQECLFNFLDGLSQRTAGQSGIEMPALKTYPFPYPPIELQEEFEQFAKQVDKSKAAIQKSLDLYQELFDKLINDYFGD